MAMKDLKNQASEDTYGVFLPVDFVVAEI